MVKCFAFLPRCVGGSKRGRGVIASEEERNKDTDKIGMQRPLTDYFKDSVRIPARCTLSEDSSNATRC